MLRSEAEAFERQLQWRRMRLALFSVLTANTRRKIAGELEFVELAANAAPVSAGDDAEIVLPRKEPNYAARASKQQRAFELVRVIPKAVSIEPFDARQPGGTVNAQPIRGIVKREVALCPIDAQGAEH